MSVFISGRALPLATVLVSLTCGPANAHGDGPDIMPLGATAAAPAGFLEMCERAPGECLSTARPSERMLSDVRAWAGRARWASVFRAADIPIASAAISPSSEQGRTDRNPARKTNGARPSKVFQSAALPEETAARETAEPSVIQPRPAIPSPVRVVAHISVQDLEAVTRRINRGIRRSSDAAIYGRDDLWTQPEGRQATGDCEDYVLAKRRALIDQGVDPAALSIAVVRTRRGELHAVLLVATPEGEQVLDNLTPWVLPWREAPYDWLQRQAPGQPLVWVLAAA